MSPMIPPDVQDALRRYMILQQEERRIREEKKVLQEVLARYMAAQGLRVALADVEGHPLKVRYHSVTTIEYDEEVLRRRLGPRYELILAPDWKKVRAHLAELHDVLKPHLNLVGSPDPDRVRFAVEQRLVSIAEFEGAFRKTTRDRLSVHLVRGRESPPPGSGEKESENP